MPSEPERPSEALKPCPVCGGVVVMKAKESGSRSVYCDMCGLGFGLFMFGISEAQVVELCNRRVPPCPGCEADRKLGAAHREWLRSVRPSATDNLNHAEDAVRKTPHTCHRRDEG